MSDSVLKENFEKAVNVVNNFKKLPSNSELLNLYSLYRQSYDGKNNTPKPSILKIRNRAKWNAWNNLGDMSKEEAMQKYINLSIELFKIYG